MRNSSLRKAPKMPNIRPVTMTYEGHQYRVTPRLKGVRGFRPLMWLPYITGQQASIIVKVEVIGEPYLQAIAYNLMSNIKHGGLDPVCNGQLHGERSLSIEAPREYISAPGEYRWEMRFGSAHSGETLGDFSAFARDRFTVTFIFAGGALLLAIAGLVVAIVK